MSCSLVDANNTATIFASSASLPITVGQYVTFAVTQVVSLPVATQLTIECDSSSNFSGFPIQFQALSIYAISFAP
jgi:hypothetical protein